MICKYCGNEFEPIRVNQRYCSTACRDKQALIRNRELWQLELANRKQQKNVELTKKLQKSKREGLSYGKFVAKKTIEEYARVKL